MKKIVEICCGSYHDALQAYKGGAKRIELNSALHLGGLTPTIASLVLTKKNTDLEVICMIRPRGAGFCYNDEDFEVMIADCKVLLANGADGIAFGILTEDGKIDMKRNKIIVDIIHSYEKTAVFHRAIDVVGNIDEAMKQLIELGVDRVLTSGQEIKAFDGIDTIKHMQQNYGERIEILAGSGINAMNAKMFMKKTGIHQVHSSAKTWNVDKTTNMSTVSFAYNDCLYDVVSEELVQDLLLSIK